MDEDTKLLMHCVLLAFQYYPPHPVANSTAMRLLNESSSDDIGAVLAPPATTTTVHPSYATTHNARDFIADCTKTTESSSSHQLPAGSSTTTTTNRPYDLSWELKLLWIFLFSAMLLVAIVGNCIVIWIVLGGYFMGAVV